MLKFKIIVIREVELITDVTQIVDNFENLKAHLK